MKRKQNDEQISTASKKTKPPSPKVTKVPFVDESAVKINLGNYPIAAYQDFMAHLPSETSSGSTSSLLSSSSSSSPQKQFSSSLPTDSVTSTSDLSASLSWDSSCKKYGSLTLSDVCEHCERKLDQKEFKWFLKHNGACWCSSCLVQKRFGGWLWQIKDNQVTCCIEYGQTDLKDKREESVCSETTFLINLHKYTDKTAVYLFLDKPNKIDDIFNLIKDLTLKQASFTYCWACNEIINRMETHKSKCTGKVHCPNCEKSVDILTFQGKEHQMEDLPSTMYKILKDPVRIQSVFSALEGQKITPELIKLFCDYAKRQESLVK
jgi:hypothetical protein